MPSERFEAELISIMKDRKADVRTAVATRRRWMMN